MLSSRSYAKYGVSRELKLTKINRSVSNADFNYLYNESGRKAIHCTGSDIIKMNWT